MTATAYAALVGPQGNDGSAPGIKGWCPGALRPMASGDGLVVRVRARCGALSLDTLAALADIAVRLGNGHIDVTRRANLQLRGIADATLPAVLDALSSLGLLDASPEAEAVRNIMMTPLAGLDAAATDVREIGARLERLLADDTRLHALPGKFGYVVDGGGVLPVAGEMADIAMRAEAGGATAAIGIAGRDGWNWLGRVASSSAAEAARDVALAFQACRTPGPRGRLRDATPAQIARIRAAVAPLLIADAAADSSRKSVSAVAATRIGIVELACDVLAVGIGVPFGRLEASALTKLVTALREAGADEVRLSPWRVVYARVRDRASADAVLGTAAAAGFVVAASDPMLRLEACPGSPDCPQARGDTRNLARRLASAMPATAVAGAVHVSGCTKGCARSKPAALTVVADGDWYLAVRNGCAVDAPIARFSTAAIEVAPERVLALAVCSVSENKEI